MLYPTISFGKTYKSDGSIISNSGEIIKESRSVRYQKAQKAFQNGEEITDWPTVKANKNGRAIWERVYGGNYYEEAHDVVQNSDGGFTIIGEKCLIASQTGIAGCVVIEDEVTIWGQVGTNSGITIGKGAVRFRF